MKMIKMWMATLMLAFSQLIWAGPINVNTANAESLAKELVGVGPKIAEAIVAERENGPYKDAEDLIRRVKGIGEKFLERNGANLLFSD